MDYSSTQNISQIISSLSHELRTPITILSSNLQLLKNNDSKLDEEMRTETFQLCEEALKSVTNFLDGIHFLNLANKKELKRKDTPINLNQFIKKILNERNTLFYKSDRIKVMIDQQKIDFCTDELLLGKILTNLIENAYKFSAKDVLLTITNDRNFLDINIEDQGVGIPEDKLHSIFLPFFRCENVKMLSGTGLGLPIAQKATDCLGGEITITSTLSKGTKVKLKIPSNEC